MNKFITIGRLTKDVELKTTASGKAVVNFSLAVDKGFKNENGQYDADFFNYVAYDKIAETISKYVHKGDRFGVVGRLQTRAYEKDGAKHTVYEVVVESFDFLEAKKTSETTPALEPLTDTEELPF